MIRDLIVFAGSVAQKPFQGGHTWVFLQYLLGFKRLGWDVLFLDRLEPEMCTDERGDPCTVDRSANLRYLSDVMVSFGMHDAFAVALDGGSRFIGMTREEVKARVARAATFINVMGFFNDPDILAVARDRVFLDIDPGFGQMWRELEWHDPYGGYDRYITVGQRIGQPDCTVPTCGLSWIPTRPPVVCEHWPAVSGVGSGSFTSIGAWRGRASPIDYRGVRYGLRAHEFRKFLQLPARTGEPFELALDIHAAETDDLAQLAAHGWCLADPRRIAADPGAYRAYIAGSKAEFMVAKNMYVETQSGWFSDRSACYLASGRPVLAQDTGLGGLYPLGEGLLTFRTPDEAAAGVVEIRDNHAFHARRAREMADAYFDSDIVLTHLLTRLSLV